MAKMNKEQRKILSKAVCNKAIERLTRLYSQVITNHKLTFDVTKYYSAECYHLNISRSCSTRSTPAIKPIVKKAFDAKQYTVKLDKDGLLQPAFYKSVLQQIARAKKPINSVEKAVKEFNDRMETEFIMKTSFNDLNDITGFMTAFTTKIK